MRNIIYLALLIATFLLLGCAMQQSIIKSGPEQPIGGKEIECDATIPCKEGYECVKLPENTKPTCVLPEVLESDKYKDCRVAESYPPQIICPQTRFSGEGCESDFDCDIGGCNGEICGNKDSIKNIASICLYKPEFECYSLTDCKCINGKCGWEQTEEFLDCKLRY